jgi:serine/threonine protein kinase
MAHSDVSCENIMLSSDGHAHVIDLGSSSMASFPSSCYKGKLGYLPPEARGGCVMETAAHFASDVW